MDIDVDHLPAGVTLIHVRGSIDYVTAPELQRRAIAESSPARSYPPRLLLELSGVTFLDRIGLDALLDLQDRWGNEYGTVELLTPSPSVVRLLHEADLDGESWMRPISDPPADHDWA